jgi:hypothetical protein
VRTKELPVIRTKTVSAQSFILVDTGHLSLKKKLTSSPRMPLSNARVVIDAGVFASETTRAAKARTTNPSVIAPGVAAVGCGAASRTVALKLGNTHSQQTRSQSWL